MKAWLAVLTVAAVVSLVLVWTNTGECLVDQGGTGSVCSYAPAAGFPFAIAFSAVMTAVAVAGAVSLARGRKRRGPTR